MSWVVGTCVDMSGPVWMYMDVSVPWQPPSAATYQAPFLSELVGVVESHSSDTVSQGPQGLLLLEALVAKFLHPFWDMPRFSPHVKTKSS